MPVPTTTNMTARPSGLGYGARLGDLFVRLAAAPDRAAVVETAPLEAERVNTAENPEDFANEFGARFSRSDFSGGEGLDYAHRRDNTSRDSTRYHDSYNIDVDDEGRVRLLHATEQVDATAELNLYATMAGGVVYWTDGDTLQTCADPEAATPTVTPESPHGAEGATDVQDVVALGDDVYCTVADGIHRKPSGGAWAHYHAHAGATRLWQVKGRLLFVDGAELYELDGTPTETLLVTLPAGQTWTAAVDAGTYVLVAATDGYLYAFTFDPSSGFALAGQTWLEGEQCYALTAAWGVVLYGTGQQVSTGGWVGRLYRAVVASDGVLADIDRLRRWGDPTSETLDRRPRWMAVGNDSVFTAVAQAADEVNLWRYDLRFGALHRSYVVGAGSVSRDGLLVDGVPWVWVDGDGVWRRGSTYAETGWLIGPLADFYLADDKSWAGITLAANELAGDGSQIDLSYTTDREAIEDNTDSDWVRLRLLTSGTLAEEARLIGVDSRYLAVKLDLYASSDGTVTPVVEAFTVRAYPGAGDMLIKLPVNVSDQIERPGKRRQTIRGYGASMYAALAGIEGTSTSLELFATGERFQGMVMQVTTPFPHVGGRGFVGLVSQVTFRGRRVEATEEALSTSTFGYGVFGQGMFGQREQVSA